ncbi:hypothetical protein BSK56_32170 [Paenibacillus borealis]|uniref:Transposase n=1 Tax=Paenibacillus borealis TaxID=160799 RepID=A0ABX3GUU0_PAEBO|nr:hypothetical protein BSK56_32170 [Paenibacillus borealis]
MNKKYEIRLEPKEREWIEQLLHAEHPPAFAAAVSCCCFRMKIKVPSPSRLKLPVVQESVM